jgi:hypothetical protein
MHKYGFIILALLLLSCKDTSVNNQNQNNDKPFFEIEYINYAWGFSYEGTMVDHDGSVYTYDPAKDTVAPSYNADGYYTEQEMQSKYNHVKTFIRKVAEDSLEWSYDLAVKVTINDFSDTTRVGADMGSLEYSVYIYRPQNSKYQKILLKVEGNLTFYNKSESAIALVTWMKKL